MYPFIILCGGLASRLGKIAKNTPKCLLPINNKPFLYYQIKRLENYGATQVYLSIGHLSEKFYEFENNYKFKNITINLIEDGAKPLGTGGAIKKILEKIKTPAFVMYGDSYLQVDFQNIYELYDENHGPFLVIYKNNNQYDKSNIFLDSENNVHYCKKNPHPRAEYIDYGVGIYKFSDFKNMKEKFDLSLVQEEFSRLNKLQFFIVKKRFYEIGTPSSYIETKNLFESDENL